MVTWSEAGQRSNSLLTFSMDPEDAICTSNESETLKVGFLVDCMVHRSSNGRQDSKVTLIFSSNSTC